MEDQKTPMNYLAKAQIAISRKEFNKAAQTFTLMMEAYPQMSKALPLLSRCSCYFELKEFEKCIQDAKEVLKCKDQPYPEELANGCYTTHSAANFHIARAYKQLGDEDNFNKYQKDASKAAQANAMDVSNAQTIRMEGNDYFGRGDYDKALEKYNEALKLDPTSEVLCGNICTIHYKRNEIEKAEYFANECVRLNPKWPKGYYRKGMVLLKKAQYMEAANCFIKGLQLSPDDVEMKKLYMKATALCNEVGSKLGGFNKKVMGILMQVQASSWNVITWYMENYKKIQYIPLQEYNNEFSKHFEDMSFKRSIENSMKTKYSDYKMNNSLKEYLSSKEDNYEFICKRVELNSDGKEKSIYDYILKTDSLITYSYLLTLAKISYPDIKDWCIAITFAYPENKKELSGIPVNPIYGAIVSRSENKVIDVFKEIKNVFGGIQSFDNLMKSFIEQKKKIYDKSKKEDVGDALSSNVIYTFDQELYYNEFLENYNAGEKLEFEYKHNLKTNPPKITKTTTKNLSSSSSNNNNDKNKSNTNSNSSTVAASATMKSNSPNKLTKRSLNKNKKEEKGKGKEKDNMSENDDTTTKTNKNTNNKNPIPKEKESRMTKIRNSRYYKIAENTILFFIIFYVVRYYTSILHTIYKFAFSNLPFFSKE